MTCSAVRPFRPRLLPGYGSPRSWRTPDRRAVSRAVVRVYGSIAPSDPREAEVVELARAAVRLALKSDPEQSRAWCVCRQARTCVELAERYVAQGDNAAIGKLLTTMRGAVAVYRLECAGHAGRAQ